VRHHPLGAEIAQRQQRAARAHQGHGAAGNGGEAVAGNVERLEKCLARGVEIAAAEIGFIRPADGVDEEIKAIPAPGDVGEGGIDAGLVGNVAGQHEIGADARRQRADPALQRLALEREGQFRALRSAGIGDAPGQRAVIGDPHHDTTAAGEQGAHGRGRGAAFLVRFRHGRSSAVVAWLGCIR